MISAQDAILIYKLLAANDIQVWLTGGWGIDALFGKQTRPHKRYSMEDPDLEDRNAQ